MSKSHSIQEFDENFFSSIAVPKVKDYSRLSSSPSRDQPCETSYFEKHFPNLECDTPVKMRLPAADRESDDALPAASMDNFLSSSSSSESTTTAVEPVKPIQNQREPLRIAPNESSEKTYGENQLIEGLEKLTMFSQKAPEERLSQRRRSEQKKKQDEEQKRRSAINSTSGTVASTGRARSNSKIRSREPSVSRPMVPPPVHNSVSRTISAPGSTTGVVTRSMAAARAEKPANLPAVRRSVMPLKIAQGTATPSAPGTIDSGDRSRDRTRRFNTTGSSTRRSVMPPKGTAPVAPPRRSASASKQPTVATAPVNKSTPKNRPMATANRSSMLRMSATKSTASPAALAPANGATSKPSGQAPVARGRQPLRVNPGTPSAAFKKPVKPTTLQDRPPVLTRARSVDRSAAKPTVPGNPSQHASRADLFNRLATPKVSATTPSRVSHDGPSSTLRKTAVRPVPSFVYRTTKNGLPSSGGLHGIRAPSKGRSAQKPTEGQPQQK